MAADRARKTRHVPDTSSAPPEVARALRDDEGFWVHNAALPGTLALLQSFFGGALELFNVEDSLRDWGTRGAPEPYRLCGGMAFAALDYYWNHHLFLPRVARAFLPWKCIWRILRCIRLWRRESGWSSAA